MEMLIDGGGICAQNRLNKKYTVDLVIKSSAIKFIEQRFIVLAFKIPLYVLTVVAHPFGQ